MTGDAPAGPDVGRTVPGVRPGAAGTERTDSRRHEPAGPAREADRSRLTERRTSGSVPGVGGQAQHAHGPPLVGRTRIGLSAALTRDRAPIRGAYRVARRPS
jgi:hypothetical protein